MMINKFVLKMELKRSFTSFITWVFLTGVSSFLLIILYPLVKDLYEGIPKELLSLVDMFGGIPENVVEYFATEIGMLLSIIGSIYAAICGYNAIAREEKEKTLDFVYSLPISRNTYFFTKLVSVIIQISLFQIITTLINILAFVSVEGNGFGSFFIFELLLLVTLLMIASLAFSFACLLKKSTNSAIAMMIPLPLYVIRMISSLSNNEVLSYLKYITPYTFSDSIAIIKNNEDFEWINFIFYLAITTSILIISNLKFRKKEFLT